MGEKWQNLPFMSRTRTLVPVPKVGTGTKSGYRYRLDRGKVVLIPIKVVPVAIHQKRVGTGTEQSGTGIDASSNPDFCTLALLSPKFVH